jgi:hypothetical protein
MTAARNRNISTWYRGTLRYDAQTDILDMWPSAMSNTSWSVYHLRVRLAEALSLLQLAEPADRGAMMSKVFRPAPIAMP